MRIRAAVFESKGAEAKIEDLDLDDNLLDKEILVRIVACAICHADIALRDQLMPFPLPAVLGHEGTGVVERVGAHVETVRPGDHVILTFPNDGTCDNCLRGRPRWCESNHDLMWSGKRSNGGRSALSRRGQEIYGHELQQSSFATYAIATEMNAVVVPKSLPLDKFVLGCGFMTGAGGVLNALCPEPGTSIVIYGAGGVGSAAIMAAKIAGCSQIIAIEPHKNRRDIALSIGATHALDPQAGKAEQQVKEITGKGAHYALMCAGDAQIPPHAMAALRMGGVCGIIGDPGVGVESQIEVAKLLASCLTLHAINGGEAVARTFIPQLIDAHQRGLFPLEKVTRNYKFDDINTAIRDAESGETIKPVLQIGAVNS